MSGYGGAHVISGITFGRQTASSYPVSYSVRIVAQYSNRLLHDVQQSAQMVMYVKLVLKSYL